MPERAIVHLDADAFFATVEQASDPKLRGKPIAVGGEKRGIIASASYEARRYGIYTPMPTARARKLCPKLIVLSGDYERYEQFSKWMFSYPHDFTPDVEQTSIDEGYFDLTGSRQPAVEIALTIRKAISQKLKITVSEGIGTNKLVSSVASKLTKPAAFFQVPPGGEAAFLHPLPNKWLPGIGPKTSVRLNSAGLAAIHHVASTPLSMLELVLGNQAAMIRQFAHGIDERPLIMEREPQKTFSEQETFSTDLTDEEYIEAVLLRMADKLFADVRDEGRTVRTLTVRVRYNDMGEDQVSESLPEPTDLESEVYGLIRTLLHRAWKRRVSLRLVSLKLSNLYKGVFSTELPILPHSRRRDSNSRLIFQIDVLRKSMGQGVILRAHDLRLRLPPMDALSRSVPCAGVPRVRPRPVRRNTDSYVPLWCHSHYSFLDSTLSPTALIALAKQHGLSAMALTDIGNLHGAVEFVSAARAAGVKPLLGAELYVEGKPLLLYAQNAKGYNNLCRLLSRHARQVTGDGEDGSVAAQQRRPFQLSELDKFTNGLIAIGVDAELASLFPNAFYQMVTAKEKAGNSPCVAAPPVYYAAETDRQRYDILQSIRTLTLLRQQHPDKRTGGRLHFRSMAEMNAGCKDHPEWLHHSLEIAERCNFEFPFGKPQFPAFIPPEGTTAKEFLYRLVLQGLKDRYGQRAHQFQPQVMEELGMIADVGYENYFLITWDMLQEGRRRGIEWITRGSAADSLVCYCLGISGVCPVRFDLYFRRFLNKERMALNKLPDIDIDFAHDRKDDVIALLFEKYGQEHCAVVGGFSTFQARSAFAEVAKVLGVAEREVRKFTDRFPWSFGSSWEPTGFEIPLLTKLMQESIECRDLPLNEEPYKTALETAQFLDEMPRYPIRVPVTRVKGLTERTTDKILEARKRGEFLSLADFFHRVGPSGEELEAMIRAGAFDCFGESRTRQFWFAQYLLRTFAADKGRQSWLIPPTDPSKLPKIPVVEPTTEERLRAEAELFGFAVSAHPLELFKDIAWNTYCPVNRLGEFIGQMVKVCGLVVEQRIHHQVTGEPMKFLSLADWTGIIETELFAKTYKKYGLATVRYPLLEIEARVEPFENGRGFTLRALRAGPARKLTAMEYCIV